ncbi:Uncharacterised protein [Mycobacterium tuberculosis]|uniref:Uncharacterized protein n=1 Tax=Mycobacterium tuberculosis TaxID=1773 RepID=A0A0U0RIV7_MYCTX|nr:Uncharacterised protein [Mycobacterium tuberculosis]CFE47122.1 Uncharacterised protein [Mycobacterium tuberculosis]COW11562.1 Uncharacterised protein [Mycobacterium tuberculosis]COW16911.1 Uncharacterised protein [Mycobacterium tuberculosis]COX24325.1 Uncharacterised protein [Mycobacterium tuberculosis]
MAILISRWRRRKAPTRSAIRWPARAKNNNGNAAPSANVAVSTTVPNPMVAVAPATTIAARIGPAQGTYNTPRARPSPKPLLRVTICFCGIRENGFSRSCSNRGKMRPAPIATKATSAAQRMASCGRCSTDSNAEPSRVTMPKLSTRPPITR